MSVVLPNQVHFDGSVLVNPIGTYPTSFTRIRWVRFDAAHYDAGGFYIVDDPTTFNELDYCYIGSYADQGEPWRQVIYLATEGNPAFEPIFDGDTGADYNGPTAVDPREGWTMLAVVLDEAALTVQLFDKQGTALRSTNVLTLPGNLTRTDPISRYTLGGSGIAQGTFDWLGWFGPFYEWSRVLSAAEIAAQAMQIAPIDRTGLLHFFPGLDQPFTRNAATGETGTQFGTSGGIAATNPPIPWTSSGMLL